jgi:hypothetical protein
MNVLITGMSAIKKGGYNPPFSITRKEIRLFLFAAGSFLGSFERIDFGIFGLDFHFYMGGEVADSALPFLFRSGICAADLSDSTFDNSFTTFTVLSNNLARPFCKSATPFSPESTL